MLSLERKNLIFHLLTWTGYLILLNTSYAGFGDFDSVFLRNFITALFHAFLAYANMYFLIPRYYDTRKFKIYYGLIILMIIVITPIRVSIDEWLITDIERIPFEFYTLSHHVNVIISSIVTLLISGGLLATEKRYKNNQLKQELKNYQLEAELRLLRTQINPHFLFNALNNIYSLAYTKSDLTAPTISRLSEMMRYMLDSTKHKKVALEREIHYLNDYISMEQLKKGNQQNITFQVEGQAAGLQIEPLLFIPFFENAFKHGNISDLENGWLKAHLKLKSNELVFNMENSQIKLLQLETIDEQNSFENTGTGLENINKRLKLLYPGRHELNINQNKNVFTVYLKLMLK